MSTLKKLFGAQIRIHRTRMNLTQTQLANRIGLSEEMIGKMERGTAGASFKTIERLCGVFDVPPNSFFPAQGLSHSDEKSVLGDMLVQLSKLNEAELKWAQRLLNEALKHP
ncbi:MAG: helix-turn-helix transcriptional regulator [Maricaulaceae bacterium]